MIPGMKNYFGKTLGRTLMSGIEALSPIEIHRGVTRRGLRTVTAAAENFMNAVPETFERTMSRASRDWTAAKGRGATIPDMISNYFRGGNLRDLATGSELGAEAAFRQRARMIFFGGLGAYAGGNILLGENNRLSDAVSFGMRGYAHAAIGSALFRRQPLFGGAYLGLAGLNALRRGDNIGPM